MSTLAATHPTLLDLKSRLDASGNVIPVIEMLSQTNEIIEDAVFLEANELTGHTTSVRTGIPEPTWRKLYGGVQPSKTTSVKVREGLGMLENYAEVDKSLADLNNNSAAWRLSEEQGIIEGFGQKLARYMIYGNEATEPEGFTGLAPRFNDQAAVNGENILTSAATPDGSDNTSLWVVVWGPNTCHMVYPKGSQAGLQIKDKGQVTIENIDGAHHHARRHAHRGLHGIHHTPGLGAQVNAHRDADQVFAGRQPARKPPGLGAVPKADAALCGQPQHRALRRAPA